MSAYSDKVIADGATLYLRLDETSGTTVTSQVGSYTGTISAGVTLNQPSALIDGNPAMTFNGTTGKISVPNGTFLSIGTGPLTVEFWIKTVSIPSPSQFIVDDANATGNTPGFYCYISTVALYFVVSKTGANTGIHTGSTSYGDGQWHHIVGVLTRGASDQIWIYQDGVQKGVGTLPATGWDLTSTNAFTIGTYGTDAASSNRHFPGTIDEVAIYPLALTASQIATHYALRGQAVFQAASTYAWATTTALGLRAILQSVSTYAWATVSPPLGLQAVLQAASVYAWSTVPASLALLARLQAASAYVWTSVPAVLTTPSWPSSIDIDRALVGRLLADPRLAGLMPDGVFWDEAKQNATQFIIVSLIDETDDPMFEKRAAENAVYLVKAVALNTSGADVAAAAARIDALLDYKTFTINGYTLMISRRIARIRSTEVDDLDPSIRWQHHGGRYEVAAASTL